MPATVVYVAYRTERLDLAWVPAETRVLVVHNDDALDPARCPHPHVEHLRNLDNLGFGAAVNRALEQIAGGRVILVNPDTALRREHWHALTTAGDHEVVIIPLVDAAGTPTSVVNRYPTPLSATVTAFRLGRFVPRGGRLRPAAARLLGRWGHDHATLLQAQSGRWPLREYWASAAVISIAAVRLREIGGFDEAYFLYMEDVDLCRRLGDRYPEMSVRLATVPPGEHAVGGSATGNDGRVLADGHRLRSMLRYCAHQPGGAWALSRCLVRLRMHGVRAARG